MRSATCHLDSLEVILQNANDIAYGNALLSCHVIAGRDVTKCNYNALFICIPIENLIKKNLYICHNILR